MHLITGNSSNGLNEMITTCGMCVWSQSVQCDRDLCVQCDRDLCVQCDRDLCVQCDRDLCVQCDRDLYAV